MNFARARLANIELDSTQGYVWGRAEVLDSNEVWGTICKSNWEDADAMVFCKQIGLEGTGYVHLIADQERLFIFLLFYFTLLFFCILDRILATILKPMHIFSS